MATQITAKRVRELVEGGAQLLEVLPRAEFEEQHLPGATSIPLKELDADTVAGLDRGSPVIVYCWDSI
jgi:rhodanese-related sulfurtransferase